ncbi:hypothetical protein MZJ48_004556 [Vibrio parahaemolyticus]|nr:hypothetical protein [Vibrio parahaemolyticus]
MITKNSIENDSYHWEGIDVSPEPLVEVIKYLKSLGYSAGEEQCTYLYESLLEGMLNIKQHAYSAEEDCKWTIDVSSQNNSFIVILRDFGLTIPTTFIKKISPLNDVEYIDDSVLIHEAVNSNFHLERRGLGLKSIISQVSKGTFEKVEISSGKGILVYGIEGSIQKRPLNATKGTSIAFYLTSGAELK